MKQSEDLVVNTLEDLISKINSGKFYNVTINATHRMVGDDILEQTFYVSLMSNIGDM